MNKTRNLKCILTQAHMSPIWGDNDALTVFARNINYLFLPDRFNYLNKFSYWKLSGHDTPFPKKNYIGNFSDLMYKRGEDLVNKAKSSGCNLYVLWSGGVDSTAVVLSILASLGEDKSILKIIHTNSSIDEYYKFYLFLKNTAKLDLINVHIDDLGYISSEFAKTNYLITGFPADQLFGSIVNQEAIIPFNADWRLFIKKDKAIQQFEEAFTYYNLPITQFNQFTWFMNFSCKWNIVNYLLPDIFGYPAGNTINFFNTQEFQDWSVSNFDKLHKYDQKDSVHYKLELKQFINKNFNDNDYFVNKGKFGSIALARSTEKNKVQMRVPHISLLYDDNSIEIKHYTKKVHSY